jgi:hypothetical protein
MEGGDLRPVGKNMMTANCLCTAHNNALSPLDAAAGRFFAALERCDTAGDKPQHHLFSGHDLERWLLKTAAGLAASRNLADAGKRLPGAFEPSVRVAKMLLDSASWTAGAGLYFTQRVGTEFLLHGRFDLAPLFDVHSESISGVLVIIAGLEFTFLAAPLKSHVGTPLEHAIHRPGRFSFRVGAVVNEVELSWDDGRHHPSVRMEFVRSAPVPEALLRRG